MGRDALLTVDDVGPSHRAIAQSPVLVLLAMHASSFELGRTSDEKNRGF